MASNVKYKAPFEAGDYYHVFHHAVGNENLFRERDNYRYFLDKLNKHLDGYCELTDWCLMPNHFHLIVFVKPTLAEYLSAEEVNNKVIKCFADFMNGYTKAMNKKYKRWGTIFAGRFRRIKIIDNTHLENTRAYLRSNPVHHGFTDNPDNWPHLFTQLNAA
ncbi:MAG: transposase [Bacteroidia bacterium]|jgi:REP element-mobilizing transposase RayT|nr:transposase [Bacteroidia bacterium]